MYAAIIFLSYFLVGFLLSIPILYFLFKWEQEEHHYSERVLMSDPGIRRSFCALFWPVSIPVFLLLGWGNHMRAKGVGKYGPINSIYVARLKKNGLL